MSGGVYLVQGEELVEMAEEAYASEDRLQELLAKYPNLLAGDQIDSAEPRRWLLVSREMSLASEQDGAGRWSVDHLFLDQDAIPTIVEVKRSTDTRIRREVVGQMLDYAANGVVYWPVESLQAQFEAGREDHEHALSDLLQGTEADPREFWQKVRTNLQAGKVRLIFVSDKIPDELRRIVEFLNEQMNPAEVVAVEIKQYVSQDSNSKTLVPRIIGQTAKAQDNKSGGSRGGKKWDEKSFFQEIEVQAPEAVKPARAILDWAKEHMPSIYWGTGRIYGTFIPGLHHKGIWHQVIGASTDGSIEVQFQYMKRKPPFDEESKRRELLELLNEISGINIPASTVIGRRPWFYLSVLQNETRLDRFLKALDWFVREVSES